MGGKHILSIDNLLYSAPKFNVFLLKGPTNGNSNLGQGVEEYFHREFNDHDDDDMMIDLLLKRMTSIKIVKLINWYIYIYIYIMYNR